MRNKARNIGNGKDIKRDELNTQKVIIHQFIWTFFNKYRNSTHITVGGMRSQPCNPHPVQEINLHRYICMYFYPKKPKIERV